VRLPIASGLATVAVASTLYPLFAGGEWFISGLGAVLMVTAMGVLASYFTFPRWLPPLTGLAVLWIYLTAVFAGEEAWAWVVPTRESVLALTNLMGTGFEDIQRFAAPVPSTEAITLLTTGGIGLIAVLVDLLASRMRKAALAGLPLLALFVVPAEIITDPIGWPAFILAAIGYTGLLLADGRERIGHWGRAVLVRRGRNAGGGVADTQQLRLSGKRIGVTAIALAILLPALLPTLEPNPIFSFGVGNGNGRGGNTISIPNPIVSLKGQLTLPENATVLTYQSSDNVPRYLRIWSLDIFTGEQWTMTAPTGSARNRVENGPLPPPAGQGPSVPVTRANTSIQISEDIDELQFLPMPYPAGQVTAEGDWRADESTLMVFSTRDYAGGLRYQVTSAQPAPTPELLNAAGAPSEQIADRYLRLPRNLPPQIRDKAQEVAGQETTAYRQAVALQEWFTRDGDFSYNLRTQGHGNSALYDFLINSRVGYCEQFSAAMAVMARILGIPARVAIGYTGGNSVGGGTYQVGTHDSHAWPELYFEGVGWLAFEPTPSGGLGQGTARTPGYSVPPVEEPGTGDETAGPTTSASPDAAASTGGPDTPRNLGPLDREGVLAPVAVDEGTPVIAQVGLGVAVLLLVLLIPAVLRVALRGRRLRMIARPALASAAVADDGDDTREAQVRVDRRAASVSAAWAELDDALYDYGMSRQASETPRALARRLTEQYEFGALPADAMARIASATERMLFARTPGEVGPMAEDVRRIRRALAATVSRGRRIRAVLLPPSTLRRMRRMGERLLDGFDRLENLRIRRPSRKAG
jgi:transglutaminase-like putative cysteine protease